MRGRRGCGGITSDAHDMLVVRRSAERRRNPTDSQSHARALIVTCDTGSEHPDNLRFRRDCEAIMGRKVQEIRSDKYRSTHEVWRHRRFISSPYGAPCSAALKRNVRENFEQPGDTQVFGYTSDANDRKRASRFSVGVAGKVVYPLIDRGIDKAGCLDMIIQLGVAPPITYSLGMPNANCAYSGCAKASSPDYWSLIRKISPVGFAETAAIAREIGAKPVEIHKVRTSLDDLPADWPTTKPIAPSCDFMCSMGVDEIGE